MISNLQDFGLSEKEAKIYLTLLKKGSMTGYELSKHVHINRGYMYELLNKMLNEGMISEFVFNGKSNYQASNPEHLLVLHNLRTQKLESTVNELKRLEKGVKTKTRIEVYRGPSCFRVVLKDIISNLKKHDEVLVLGFDDEKIIDLEPIYVKKYFNFITKNGIKERVIVSKNTNILLEAKTTKYKFLSQDMTGRLVQMIYADKVALFTIEEPFHLIIIQDAIAASTYKKHFEIFWRHASS